MSNYDWAMATYKDWSTINLKIELNSSRWRSHFRDGILRTRELRDEIDAIEEILASRGVPFRPHARSYPTYRRDKMQRYKNRLRVDQWHHVASALSEKFPFIAKHIRYYLIGKTTNHLTTIGMWLFFDEFRAIARAVASIQST